MKIAISTIALNEEKFVNRFLEMAKEADAIYVLDTGSSDKTVEMLRAGGAIVVTGYVKPWRFDVARNAALDLVSLDYDIVVSVDLDEVFETGWADAIRRAWTPETTRLRYKYTWSHNEDGTDGITFWYDKIVSRKMYRWILPVHEIFSISQGFTENQTYTDEVRLHHYPDNTKSRSSYLPLLEMAAKEAPKDDRTAHYYGRELMFYGRYDEAIIQLKHHLQMPTSTWAAERCASMRFIARCYLSLANVEEAIGWALRACAESPKDREPWGELAKICYQQKNHAGVYYACAQALAIIERPTTYICEPFAWNHELYDLGSNAAWNLGMHNQSFTWAQEAVRLAPTDERLIANLAFLQKQKDNAWLL